VERSPRLPGENDDAFRVRVERAAHIARALIEGCLANTCMQEYMADPDLPEYTEERNRQSIAPFASSKELQQQFALLSGT